MSQFKSVDTHGAGPPIQVPADELDAATVERCAQWHDEQAELAINSLHCGDNTQTIATHHRRCQWHRESASAIRSLIPNSAGAGPSSHFSKPCGAGESDPVVTQDSAPAGTVSETDARAAIALCIAALRSRDGGR